MPDIKFKSRLKNFAIGCFIFVFAFVSMPRPKFTFYQTSTNMSEEEKICRPRKHVVFLKNHKCGSSAIQNILLRFGYKNNLTFAFPEKTNYFGHPAKFKANMIPKMFMPPSGKVDIFCIHTRLDAQELQKVVPEDAVWVAAVRDPVNLFESLYDYFKLSRMFKKKLQDFNHENVQSLLGISRSSTKNFGKNQMSFDLGLDENIPKEQILGQLEILNNLFDVIIIKEKMEESLILLKHKLCWEMEDVVVFLRNARRVKFDKALTPEAKIAIEELNYADKVLYEYFLDRHTSEVAQFGEERMRVEVLELRRMIENFYQRCVQEIVPGRDNRLDYKEYAHSVYSFILKPNANEECHLLTLPELDFINKLKYSQLMRLHEQRGKIHSNLSSNELF